MSEEIKFEATRFGSLDIVVCKYELGLDVTPMPTFDTIYLHNTYKHPTPEALLRFHRSLGWSGIGYHFAVSPDGVVYNTRPFDVQGAHAYGRNSGSLGIVLLDIDACADSPQAQQSFRELYAALGHVSERFPQLHSHTFGQFEYLNDLIATYNTSLVGRRFPEIEFDDNICRQDVYIERRRMLTDAIMQHRRFVRPEKNEDFRRIVWFSDKLKICPGEKYETFAQLIGDLR